MNVIFTEMDVWNDSPQDFKIGKREYRHKLLNAYYYFKFLDKIFYYMLILKYMATGLNLVISQSPEKLLINKESFNSLMNNKKFRRQVVYNVFVCCFYNRCFFPEEITFTRHPIKWLFFKPILIILDNLQRIKTNRISFSYFEKNTDIIKQTEIFFGILYEQTEGVKKKADLLIQTYEKKFLVHLPRGTLSKVLQGAEEFLEQKLTTANGRLIDPATIKSVC